MPQTYTKTTRRVDRRVVWTRNGRDYVRRRAKDGTMRFTAVSSPRKQRGGSEPIHLESWGEPEEAEENPEALEWKNELDTVVKSLERAHQENIKLKCGKYKRVYEAIGAVKLCIDECFIDPSPDGRGRANAGIFINMKIIALSFDDPKIQQDFLSFYNSFVASQAE